MSFAPYTKMSQQPFSAYIDSICTMTSPAVSTWLDWNSREASQVTAYPKSEPLWEKNKNAAYHQKQSLL
jgi:hypothetical protein